MRLRSSASSLKPGDHGTTFGGSPVPAAAALEHLKIRDVVEWQGMSTMGRLDDHGGTIVIHCQYFAINAPRAKRSGGL